MNATIGRGDGIGTILNDDTLPVVRIDDMQVKEGDSGTTDAIFTVSLSAASSDPVSVSFATQDGTAKAGSDYIAASGTVTFKPGTPGSTSGEPTLRLTPGR